MAAIDNFPKIICRVKALYAFSSTEESSLSFNKDEYIDVLSQLESGWWDGYCNGNRGWFPSNYVEIVDINPEEIEEIRKTSYPGDMYDREMPVPQTLNHNIIEEEEEDQISHMSYFRTHPNTPLPPSGNPQLPRPYSLTLPVTEKRTSIIMADSTNSYLPDGWVIQLAKDGITKYYYNRHTGGLRLDHPGEYSDDENYYSSGDEVDHTQQNTPEQPSQPSEQFEDTHDFGRAHSLIAEKSIEDMVPLEENILNAWTKRTTPQGKIYYANSLTHETTWNINEIDKSNGRLKGSEPIIKKQPSVDDASISVIKEEDIPISWKTLAVEIAQSVQNLNKAVARGETTITFRQRIAVVVDAVRFMLYSSRSMDKEAPHLQDPEIKEFHRNVLATLAKLILSAKAVNDSNLDINGKVQRDAADVLNAVRKFVITCQNKNVQIQQISPRLILNQSSQPNAITNNDQTEPASSNLEVNDTNTRRRSANESNSGFTTTTKAKFSLNQDLVVNLQTHAKQIVGSTDALCKASAYIYTIEQQQNLAIENNHDDINSEEQHSILDYRARSNVVLLFQNLSTQVGNYLGVLSDIDTAQVDSCQSKSLPEYRVNRQKLYNVVGLLFSEIQSLTDVQNDLITCIKTIEQLIGNVEASIEDIFKNIVQMVEERKILLMGAGETPGNNESNSKTNMHYFDFESERKARPHRGSINDSVLDNTSDITLVNRTYNRPPHALKRHMSFHGPSNPEEKTEFWYLGYDYAENDIEFSADKSIKGGTLRALVERLTLHDFIDMSFIANFLLTYRSFCTTEEFIDLLQERYNLRPPAELTPEELEIWTDKKQKLVRLRVLSVIKNWLDNYYNEEDEFILNKLQFFANTVICDSSSFSAEQLNKMIQKRRELDTKEGLKVLIPNNEKGPPSIIPKNMTQITLLETDPLEMARQLTIMDFKLYSSIRPIECLGKAWSRDGGEDDTAVHVKQSIAYCNQLTAWVTGSILSNKEPKKRVVVIKHWAQIANKCIDLNNYNTCMAILSAFDNSAIGRLKKTWELVSSRTSQSLAQIRKLMGSNRNFTEYREIIHSVNPPCIPFLGIYLQDLTFIEDGNSDQLKKSANLINFAKQQKSAEVIREIKQFQSPPYIFQTVPPIQDFIKAQLDNSHDIDYLYEKSLELEPRAPANDSSN
ncbi:ras guanine nucleotide exchange factor domain-containing protein [Pilobolus umbonatus]|nr:ras guanine nucleotide exchange factor domain-containing protein [Pilobolus umbonatus]